MLCLYKVFVFLFQFFNRTSFSQRFYIFFVITRYNKRRLFLIKYLYIWLRFLLSLTSMSYSRGLTMILHCFTTWKSNLSRFTFWHCFRFWSLCFELHLWFLFNLFFCNYILKNLLWVVRLHEWILVRALLWVMTRSLNFGNLLL